MLGAMQVKTAIERAFELAKSGRFETFSHLKVAIKREGYYVDHIKGPALIKQLRLAIQTARQDINANGD